MLHKETKKRIDDARDILVGQLPLPTDQVEHITLALIYKFMDDQDEELRQLEYDENFFKGDLKKYSWQNIMTNENAAETRVSLFIEGIEAIKKAEHIPALFKEIFGQALWKIREGRILMLFFNKINEFRYDHSEELGNAFEYILMTLGAQGSNGQFRTPRNIIDFIVEVVDPDKNDSILDPACGTGGFLVSAFKHIQRKNTTGQENFRITFDNQADTEGGVAVNWGDQLTPNERNTIGKNISGYDITPMMARLARTNLYLHNFTNPKIHEYDTLSSETRWKDRFSCILANPPFMTPKGGVSTHDKFKIRATKAEILFSDYIVEHLTLNGKAGFIVPEGVIFTKSGDYTQLRKWVTQEAGLWAVVSLPSGVFQPYSGVKTSIVFIDRQIARTRTEILLMKVENDGFSLNVQRNPIKKNDLPDALTLLTLCKTDLAAFKAAVATTTVGEVSNLADGFSRLSYKLLERDDFARLDAYKAHTTAWDFVKKQWKKALATDNECKVAIEGVLNDEKLKQTDKDKRLLKIEEKQLKAIAEFTEKTGCVDLWADETELKTWYNDTLKDVAVEYGVNLIKNEPITEGVLEALDWEREYSWSLERYLGQSFKIALNDDIEIKHLGEVFFKVNESINPQDFTGIVNYVGLENIESNTGKLVGNVETDFQTIKSLKSVFQKGDILFGKLRPNLNKVWLAEFEGICSTDIYVFRPKLDDAKSNLYANIFRSEYFLIEVLKGLKGAQLPRVSFDSLREIEIPLPPLSIQQAIVIEIESYQKVIDGCRLIVDNYKPMFEIKDDWERIKLGEIFKLSSGNFLSQKNRIEGEYAVYGGNGITGYHNDFFISNPTIVIGRVGEYCGAVHLSNPKSWVTDNALYITDYLIEINQIFLFHSLVTLNLNQYAKVGGQPSISQSSIYNLEIPLPPLSIQHEIVADLERDRATIEGAKALAAKMEGKIKGVIDKVWGKGV